jgi:NAD(P)-dependent dehydrogenase (short-subunit alcohol dehydrogenase family)
MMDRIWQKRPLDILVNNAAGQILAPTHKMSSRAIDAVLGIVLHGARPTAPWPPAGAGSTRASATRS